MLLLLPLAAPTPFIHKHYWTILARLIAYNASANADPMFPGDCDGNTQGSETRLSLFHSLSRDDCNLLVDALRASWARELEKLDSTMRTMLPQTLPEDFQKKNYWQIMRITFPQASAKPKEFARLTLVINATAAPAPAKPHVVSC